MQRFGGQLTEMFLFKTFFTFIPFLGLNELPGVSVIVGTFRLTMLTGAYFVMAWSLD